MYSKKNKTASFLSTRLQKIPYTRVCGIFLSKSQAWHIITRKRVSSCGLMIYKAYRFDDIQFLAELMIYTPLA